MSDPNVEDRYAKYDKFEGPSDDVMARAEARMLDRGHHRARRNGDIKRAMATPDTVGQWGSSRHRGVGKNWR